MSRQATNHVVLQMEALGYLQRRTPSDGQRRLIFLAERGKRAGDVIFGCLRELESDWSARVGPQRFSEFMNVLRELSGKTESDARTRSMAAMENVQCALRTTLCRAPNMPAYVRFRPETDVPKYCLGHDC